MRDFTTGVNRFGNTIMWSRIWPVGEPSQIVDRNIVLSAAPKA
jgi:hypothetical protein